MRAYKHIDQKHAAPFASGESIQLGLMSTYREGEGARVDPLEGMVENKIDYFHTLSMKPAHELALRSMGMMSVGGGTVTIRNCSGSLTLAPPLMFCASTDADERLRSEGQRVFEITDLEAFADALTRSEPNLLFAPMVGRVSYQRRVGNPVRQGPVFPHLFMKSEQFAFENEVRIVWAPTNERAKYQRIRSPEAALLIKPA